MGCDIHGWLEIRPYTWDKENWRAVVDLDHWERNYLMFARMFGVRSDGNIQPIAANRGLPPNGIHDEFDDWRTINVKYWEGDGHSHTWISLEEINANEKTILKPYGTYNFDHWVLLFNIMREFAKVYGEENVRLVVWFDN